MYEMNTKNTAQLIANALHKMDYKLLANITETLTDEYHLEIVSRFAHQAAIRNGHQSIQDELQYFLDKPYIKTKSVINQINCPF